MDTTRTTGRLPWPTRGELDGAAAAVYDAIVGSRASSPPGRGPADGDGRLLGPFNAMLVSPAVGHALQGLGAAIRYRTSLPDRVRELAILTVAAYRDSDFEWYAHEPLARTAGVSEPELAALRSGGPGGDGGLGPADLLVRQCVESLLAQRDLSDRDFDELKNLVGVTGIVELVTLVGYYDLLAMSMRTFRVGLPDGAADEIGASTVS